MALDQSKFVARFIDESTEHCSQIRNGLLTLEQNPDDMETLNRIFRSAHTIKGASRMMKYMKLSGLAHSVEDLLDSIRGRSITLQPEIFDLMFRTVDAVAAMITNVATTGQCGEAPELIVKDLAGVLDRSHAVPGAEVFDAGNIETVVVQKNASSGESLVVDREQPVSGTTYKKTEYFRVNAERLDSLISLMGEIVSEQVRFRKKVYELQQLERAYTQFISVLSDRHEDSIGRDLYENANSIRNRFSECVADISDSCELKNHYSDELQSSSLSLRMLPLSTVFESIHLSVREIAAECGKTIEFSATGAETELDRKIIEKIVDPLMHMVRNAIDHGLESAEERIIAGKPPKGRLVLAAYYENGRVTIVLNDDGRGISINKIREKAIKKHLYTEDELTHMNRSMLLDLVFMPGFSTSPIITAVSGRGVGMDVVRMNIVDELHGSIEIDTEEGKGTTFYLRLPLNLALFPLALFKLSGKTVAVLAGSVVELVRVGSEEIIEIVDKLAVRIREQIIPVESGAVLLGLPVEKLEECSNVLLMILKNGDDKMAVIIDEYLDHCEMVVKPLPGHLAKVRLLSGVTQGSGGKIVNLLNVGELFTISKSIHRRQRLQSDARSVEKLTILVVDDSMSTREIEKSILEAYGYNVFTADDGEMALEMVHASRFDLIITDVEMPRMDGFTLVENLRTNSQYRHVPIIIVTSRENDEDKRRGIAVGADAYIVKGAFDQTGLIDTVRSLAGHAHSGGTAF